MGGKNIKMGALVSLIFWCVAAALNACMDKVETSIAFNTSIFKNLNPLIYSKDKSWVKGFIAGTRYHLDFWHICKSFMIIFFALAWATATPIRVYIWLTYLAIHNDFWQLFFILILHLCTLGVLWNAVFNIFYNKILIYKTWNK